MDVASAQRTFDKIGLLNRIDLRLAPGTDVEGYRRGLAHGLPPGVYAVAPQVERDRAVSVTRAYRVNLNMLALVALWTGAFWFSSTQSLAVLRRRRSLALLRALGVTRGQLQRALLGEGVALGVAGSLLGIVLGALIAAAIVRYLTADLGNGQLRAVGASAWAAPGALIAFFAMGIVVAGIGAWLPARSAARQSPARSLKGGDGDFSVVTRTSGYFGVATLAVGAALAPLPARGRSAAVRLCLHRRLAVRRSALGAVIDRQNLELRTPHPTRGAGYGRGAVARNVGLSTLSWPPSS